MPAPFVDARGRRSTVEKRSGIRLSTMEIVLLGTLAGMFILGILQARQLEHLQRATDAEAEQ